MLTVEDIKNVSFRKANFGGYKPEDVDAFIDDVEASYQKMLDKNQSLCNEIDALKGKISKLQGEDNVIRELILNAKQIADNSISKAKDKTSELISKANEESEKIVTRAKKEVDFQKEIFTQLKKEASNLRKKLDDVYKEHLKIIGKIPTEMPQEIVSEEAQHFEIPDAECQKAKFENISSSNETEKEEAESTVENFSKDNESSNVNPLFQDLKFGKDYSISEDDSDSGAYSGLFKK